MNMILKIESQNIHTLVNIKKGKRHFHKVTQLSAFIGVFNITSEHIQSNQETRGNGLL